MDAKAKRLTLIACILGSVVVFVDGTIVNVALPKIRSDLGIGLSDQQWIVDAYLLTLGSLLLVGGSLGDQYGRRRMFRLGVIGFGVTSLLCALAPTAPLLIAARGLQGVTGALLVPATLGIITATFAEDERGKAIGTWTAWSGIATVIGPLAGGLILEAISWRFVFAVNLVPIAVTLALIRHMAAAHDHPRGGTVDVLGALLCALGLGGTVFALIEQPNYSWGEPIIWAPLGAGLALLVAFVLWERVAPDPMLSLDLFRRRNFAVGNASTLLVYAGLGGGSFLLPLFLQEVAGWTPLAAGTSLLPVTILMFLLSGRFGALADRLGPRWFMGAGPVVAGAGLLLFSRLGAQVDYVTDVLPGAIVFGLGLSMTVAPLTATVLGGVDEEHASLASGVNNAIARVAGLVAIALVGAVVSAAFAASLDRDVQAFARGPGVPAAVRTAKDQALSAQAPARVGASRVRLQAALTDASEAGFEAGAALMAALVIAGGVISAIGIVNPRREVKCAECPGGALAGATQDAGRAAAARVPRRGGRATAGA
ncbi:MAG TPA: MFS transporter [Solirubrobacteraceae bacterium]|nr:MFS transporter [Solirubrobacteraceae bacterium]